MEYETGEQWGKSIFKLRLDFVDYLEICKELHIPDPAAVTPMHRYTLLSVSAARITAIEKASRGYAEAGETQASVSQAMSILHATAGLYIHGIDPDSVATPKSQGGVPWDTVVQWANPAKKMAEVEALVKEANAKAAKFQVIGQVSTS